MRQKEATSHCSDCHACSLSDVPDRPVDRVGTLHGWRLVCWSGGLFVAPVVLAIAGALYGGSNQDSQLLGAVAGLALGMGVGVIAGKVHSTGAVANGPTVRYRATNRVAEPAATDRVNRRRLLSSSNGAWQPTSEESP